MSEAKIQNETRLAVGRVSGVRLFRNNVGVAFMPNGQVVRYGLGNGTGDLIGFQTIEITPDMVGAKIAVFTSVEIKDDKGKCTPEQLNWMQRVNEAGGTAFVARAPEIAVATLQGVPQMIELNNPNKSR